MLFTGRHFYIPFLLLSLSVLSCRQAFAQDWIYHVKNQDTLWDISEKYLGSHKHVTALQRLNRIKDPNHIPPGTRLVIPEHWLIVHPTMARIIETRGMAELIEGQSYIVKKLSVGDIAIEGDSITTQADSSVILQFIDGSLLILQENSHLLIDHLSFFENTAMTSTTLDLKKGRLETQVAPKQGSSSQFKINTPLSSTSVRGTDYRLSSETKAALTEVLEGSVKVESTLQKQNINGGYGIVSSPTRKTSPVKLLPAPDPESIPKLFERNPLQFSIDKPSGHLGHRLQIASDAQFQRIVFDKLTDSNIIRATDLADGQYFLRLRAYDQNGLEGLNTDLQITVNTQPEPPFILSPKQNGKTAEELPLFQWTERDTVKKYHFQLADNPSFKDPIVDISDLDEAEYTPEKSLELGEYYWRIAVLDDEGKDGPFSDIQTFNRIYAAPEAGEAEISDAGISIQFQAGLPQQSYRFQLASDENFESILVDKSSDNAVFEFDKPDSGTYFIRGKTIDPDGYSSDFGTAQKLEVPIDSRYWLLLLLPLIALVAI